MSSIFNADATGLTPMNKFTINQVTTGNSGVHSVRCTYLSGIVLISQNPFLYFSRKLRSGPCYEVAAKMSFF